MKFSFKNGKSLIAGVGVFLVASTCPGDWSEGFEDHGLGSLTNNQWNATTNVLVSDEHAYSGDNSLKILLRSGMSSPGTEVAHRFLTNTADAIHWSLSSPSNAIVWTDMRLRTPDALTILFAALMLDRGNNRMANFLGVGKGEGGNIFNNAWVPRSTKQGNLTSGRVYQRFQDIYSTDRDGTSENATSNAIQSDTWYRFTDRFNQTNQTHTYYVNGEMIMHDLQCDPGLVVDDVGIQIRVQVDSSTTGTVYIDDLYVGTAIPDGITYSDPYPARPDGTVMRIAFVGDTQVSENQHAPRFGQDPWLHHGELQLVRC